MEALVLVILVLILALIIISFFYKKKDDNLDNFIEIKAQLEFFKTNTEKEFQNIGALLREEMARVREESSKNAKETREELTNSFLGLGDSVSKNMTDIANLQKNQLDMFSQQLANISKISEDKLEKMRDTIEKQLKSLQDDNNAKLEKMRETVDEKLHTTLEKRLSDSFKIVSDRLEQVHKGLGEMQSLAVGVGDLKKVLANVKTKGILGEYQLGNILEQILTLEQYSINVKTKKGSNDNVEFAVKLPGRENDQNVVWLPIDSKSPTEDFQVLVDAYEKGDVAMIETSKKQLVTKIKLFAKDIRDKYLDPPNTTDFGIMFFPYEGLYAEVLRVPGLLELLQREYKVIITGPTTLSAILNSLQIGFRTLAIEKRTSEIWSLLGAVKTEFGNFATILEKTKSKLESASLEIERAGTRSRAIERKLRDVQELPKAEATNILGENNMRFETDEPMKLIDPDSAE
jgi:DNA recombination protein RmuC